ncbi:MAG: hypothetical protein WAY88_02975 [Minisyncoccia bacterium]
MSTPPKAAAPMSPKPAEIPVTTGNQTDEAALAATAKDKGYAKCQENNKQAIAECKRMPQGGSTKSGYLCEKGGTIKPENLKSDMPDRKKIDECKTEAEIGKEFGKDCANEEGVTLAEAFKKRGMCPSREIVHGWHPTKKEFESKKKELEALGVTCIIHRGPFKDEPIRKVNLFKPQILVAQTVKATTPKDEGDAVICVTDQDKYPIASARESDRLAQQAATQPATQQPQAVTKEKVPAATQPATQQPQAAAREPFVTTNPGTPATQQPTPTQGTQQQTVPQAPIAQQAPVQQAPIAQVAPVTQPGKTPDTQNPNKYAYNSNLSNYAPANPTGTAPKAYTPSSSTSFFDTLFNRQPEPTQKSTPIIQNIYVAQNYPQNLLNGQLPQKSTPEKITPKDTTKKIDAPVKLDSTTKPLPEKEEAETEQSRLLKAILNAPSIEEVMERGGYDYQKVVNDSAKKVTEIKNVAPDKKSEEQEKVPDEVLTVKKTPPQQKIAPAEPILATADPKLNKPPVVEPEGSERTVLQNLFAQEIQNPDFALSKNNLAQNSQRRVTSEKPETVLQIAYTQLQSAIKKIPTAPKQDLSRAERDTLASQLLSLSEYLSGNTFGADPTTAETMNTVSRQLELAATDMAGNTPPATLLNSLKVAYGELSLEQAALKKSTYAGPEPKKFSDWTPAYFEAYKKEVADALDASKNPTAIKLYRDALSRLNTAELFKKSNQTYWNSEADLAEAKTKISLAGALERNTKLSLPETGSDVAESEEVRDTTDSAPQTNPEGIRGSPTPTKNMPGTTEVTPPANAPVQKSIIGKILSWFGW